jgi:hypothetical protein
MPEIYMDNTQWLLERYEKALRAIAKGLSGHNAKAVATSALGWPDIPADHHVWVLFDMAEGGAFMCERCADCQLGYNHAPPPKEGCTGRKIE